MLCKKDLDIIFNVYLDYRLHTDTICCRTFKTLGFLIRTPKDLNLKLNLKLNNLLVSCSVTFRVFIYSMDPYTTKDSFRLERVQRRFFNLLRYIYINK